MIPVPPASRALLLATACLACRTPGAPGEPASAQRPSFSSDTATTAPDTLELEVGGFVDPHDLIDTPMTLKHGSGPSTELFVSWSPYVKVYRPGTEGRGASDVVVGTRHRFLEADGRAPSAAVQVTAKVPTGSEADGIGNGEYDFTAAGILTGALDAVSWTTYYELGVLGEEDGSGHDTRHALALSLGTHLTGALSGYGEVAGLWTRARSSNPLFTTWGLAWSEDPAVIWDVGVVVGLNDDAPDAALVFGVTRNFGRLGGREAPIH